ncbi:MAG: hypothetical protein FJ298_05570 [Planctomycetes bacterium]|nr:hypothetical protein [Planctomycetota bacterium]
MRTRFLTALCGLVLATLARAQEYGAWHVLGRFEGEFAKNSTALAFAPERSVKTVMKAGAEGPDLSVKYDGMDKVAIAWRRLAGEAGRNALDVGALDLNALCPPPSSRKGDVGNAVVYLYRRIDASSELRVPVSLGSDEGVKVWLNGEVVLEKHTSRGLNVSSDALTLAYQPGANHLLVKVTNSGGAYAFQIQPRTRISQDAINEAIDRGVQFLLREQLIDGSWGCWEHWGAGHPVYVAYTLMKCGVKKDHPAVRMALALMDHREMDTTYARACALLALEARGDADSRERMQELAGELVATQSASGLWDYPEYPGGSKLPVDMSNTLYAALALRAASKSGLEIDPNVWTKLAGGVLRCQEKPRPMPGGGKRDMAGFGYRIASDAFGSVTTGGLSCLAIAEQEGASNLQATVKSKLGPAKSLAMNWLEHHLEWVGNPGHGTAHHYFWVYGIERVGALLATEKIGEVDWYWDGASYLVRAQRGDGSWNPENYVDHQYLDTCLALLFLKRATARGSGETSKAGVHELGDPKAAVQLRATGDTPLTLWVSGLSEAVNARFKPLDGADLDVVKIEYFARFEADGQAQPALVGTVQGASARRTELQRFALRHAFDRRGRWLVSAKVHLREPGASNVEVVASGELAIPIDGVVDPARLQYAADRGRSLFFGAKLKAESSSVAGAEGGHLAVDGNHGSRWRCAQGDANPWLRITLERPARADGLLLAHALARLSNAAAPRASRVEVVVNDTQAFAIDMPNDVHAKASASFGELLSVRKVEVRIVASEGRAQLEPVGFSEIELVKSN